MKSLTPLNSRLDSRLAAYAAVATAALAAPALPSAEAAIVYSGPINIAIPLTTAGVYINLVTGVTSVTPAGAPGWDINPFSATGLSWFSPANISHGYVDEFPGGTSLTLVDNMAFGTPISALTQTTVWTTNGAVETTGPTAWNLNSSNNYVAFRFLNEATGIVNFGWAQVQLGATLTSRSIIGYGYENTGLASPVGVVPEPSTFGLLGLVAVGALGLRAWRGRKAA